MSVLFAAQMKYNLTPLLGKLFLLLVSRPIVTPGMIEKEFKIFSDAGVAVHRLRARLEGSGITVEMHRGVGYFLEPARREELRKELMAEADKLGQSDAEAGFDYEAEVRGAGDQPDDVTLEG